MGGVGEDLGGVGVDSRGGEVEAAHCSAVKRDDRLLKVMSKARVIVPLDIMGLAY